MDHLVATVGCYTQGPASRLIASVRSHRSLSIYVSRVQRGSKQLLFPLAIVFAFQDGATRTGLQRAKGARKKRMRTFVIAGTSIELRLSIRLDLDQRSDTMLLNRLPDDFSFR